MESMAAETTLTIKAVDLHTVGADVDGIRLGDTVKLVSAPHGLNKEDVCTKIDLDIEKPEKSEYTFGLPRETLTDSNASASRKNKNESDHYHRWLRETDKSLEIVVDTVEGIIKLQADYVTIKALETVIEGLVKVEDLAAKIADISMLGTGGIHATGSIQCDGTIDGAAVQGETVFGEEIGCSTLSVGGSNAAWKSATVVTSLGSIKQDKRYLSLMTADGGTVTLDIVTNVDISENRSTINYLGKE